MATATQEPAKPTTPADGVPQPLDPENDIDAKSATWWVLGGTIVLFIALWAMLPIFARVQEEERMRKVDTNPNVELEDVQRTQMEFLAGANPKNKSLEQAMNEALTR